MDPRERWQALQAHLTLARTAVDAGDRAAALAAINDALTIDPDFLAAHALRDRALQIVQAPPRPLVSPEGYAQFEQRARRRRVDRRVDAARAALAAGRVKDAGSALDEVIELDPNQPELVELTAAFELLRRGQPPAAHRGRWVAAAAAFVIVVLGASWLQEAGGLKSRSLVAVVPIAPTPESRVAEPPEVATASADAPASPVEAPVATAGTERSPSIERAIDTVAAVAAASTVAVPAPTMMPGYVAPIASASFTVSEPPPSPASVVPVPAVVPPPAVSAPPAVALPGSLGSSLPADAIPAAPPAKSAALTAPVTSNPPVAPPPPASAPAPSNVVPPTVDDRVQVQQALQRYRSAFEGLDARSARAVWPAVNESALARAFDGLESQSLTFEACDVRMRGDSADATCRGSARYVPKIGGHEPHVEPRTWNFILRKADSGWQIESARAGR